MVRKLQEPLKIHSINLRSYKNKIGQLRHHITTHDPDVLCFQETRREFKLKIAGYKLAAQSSYTLPKLGTAVLVKNHLHIAEIDLTQIQDQSLELTGVEIELERGKRVRVVNTYAQQRFPINTNAIKTQLNNKIPTIIFGDLNAKLNIPLNNETNRNGELIAELISDHDIIPILPSEHTRYQIPSAPSVIDYALINSDHIRLIKHINVLPDIGSDHRPVELILNPEGGRPKTRKMVPRPNFEKANWQGYALEITGAIPELPSIEPNKISVDRAILGLTKIIQQASTNHIPLTNPSNENRRQLPRRIVDLIERRKSLRKRHDKHGETHLKPEINELQRQIAAEVKEFDRTELDVMWQNANDKSPYGFYKLARRFLSQERPPSIIPLRDNTGEPLKTEQEKSDKFRDFFEGIHSTPPGDPKYNNESTEAATCADRIRRTHSTVQMYPEAPEFANQQTVTPERILKLISHVKNTAPGEDGIYYKHVQHLPLGALTYIAQVYTIAWRCCYFPDSWKIGISTMIPKPHKDHTNPASYRPITLLPVLGKIFERIITKSLTDHLEKENKLPASQAGFRPHQSCQDQLLRLVEDGRRQIQKGKEHSTIATMFDIEKAFDKLWHDGLLLKMHQHLSLSTQIVAFVQSFLSNRFVKFRIGEALSAPLELKAGCPQGSILSPVLFNMSVSDIPQPPNTIGNNPCNLNLSQFADDIATWANEKNPVEARIILQYYNEMIIEWCKRSRILLSASKTQVILFHKNSERYKNDTFQILNGKKIEGSKTAKFLGVTLDNKLSMKPHHQEIIQKMEQKLNYFTAITGGCQRPRASRETGLQILNSMIIPLALYAPVVTCIRTDAMLKQIDKLIARGAKLAMHLPKFTSNRYVRQACGLTPHAEVVARLAKDYITNETRSDSVKRCVANHAKKGFGHLMTKRTNLTPLDKIYLIR